MTLAHKLKELRIQKGWTQREVARLSGLDRRYISYLEQPHRAGKPSADALLKLARAFNIRPEELYQAAGYINQVEDIQPRPETPEEILERLKSATPVAIPIYADFPFHAGNSVVPIDFVYRVRPKTIGKHLEGYQVYGNCLEPEISDGDIIIVDRIGTIDNSDIIAYLIDDQLCVARLRKVADELWLENNLGKIKFKDCQITAPVVEVRRRLK